MLSFHCIKMITFNLITINHINLLKTAFLLMSTTITTAATATLGILSVKVFYFVLSICKYYQSYSIRTRNARWPTLIPVSFLYLFLMALVRSLTSVLSYSNWPIIRRCRKSYFLHAANISKLHE